MKKPLLLVALSISTITAFSTIHVTDVNQYLTSTILYIDIDLDGDNDFAFEETSNATVDCLKATSFVAADQSNIPKAYVNGAAMGTYSWLSSHAGKLAGSNGGYFQSADRYLMVKFNNTSGQTFYGWFHFPSFGSNLYIAEFGYEDVPNQMISPGQATSTGILDIATAESFIHSMGNGSVSFSNCETFDFVAFYSVDGKEVFRAQKPSNHQLYPFRAGERIIVAAFYNKERIVASGKLQTVKD